MTDTTDTTADTEHEHDHEHDHDHDAPPAIEGLKFSAEEVSDVERKLDVEVPWEEVHKRLDEAYKELGKGITLKGFRKGKVPRKMLEQLFHKHVDKEVSQRLVQDSIEPALTETKIQPVGEPRFEFANDGVERGVPFKYSATMEVVPPIEPRDYFGVDVTAKRAKVSDEDVETALGQKQREMTDYRAVEGRPTQAGDVLLVDVMGKLDGKPLDLEQRTVELGEHPTEPLAGLAAALTGVAADQEELELELDVPVAGKEGQTQKGELLVTLHDVKEKVVPELDDDFAKDTGEAETLDELRGVLRKKLEEQAEERAREEARQLLVREVIKRNDVPAVPALVERYLDQRMQLQKMLMGMDPSQPSRQDEAIRESMRDDAVEMVQSGLLLEAIGDKEKIEALEVDVEKKLAELAASREQNVAKVRADYEKEGSMEALKRRVREDKILDLLVSKANIIIEESSEEPEAEAAEPEAPADQTTEQDSE